MKNGGPLLFLLLAFFVLPCEWALGGSDSHPLAWPAIRSENRPWTWWWWHGSAVDQADLDRELHLFHDVGLGGVQITTIYGVKGGSHPDIPYLSPEWMEMLGYAIGDAKSLGMGVDMSLGSGWCFGGPTISDRDANAKVVVQTYEIEPGGTLTHQFDPLKLQALMAYPPTGPAINLLPTLDGQGLMRFQAPTIPGTVSGVNGAQGTWKIFAISQEPSGQKVKRAAPGGTGWMLNPLYPQAVTNWLKWFDGALGKYNGPRPLAVFQDSYEYRTDWSPDFLSRFAELRGYRLEDQFQHLFSDQADEQTARVKYDYRRTVSGILAQESEPAWIAWAHAHGMETIYQAHGTPANWLDLYGDADVPETEMFHNDRSVLISKFASSAAHTMGRRLVGAETGTWLKEHFTETLADVKYLVDDMFLAGVNHVYFHGTCYSPADAPWPGWLFYASTEMNPRNSIWHDMPSVNAYIARCQSLLQSGHPDSDVLLYWPVADYWSQPDGLLQPMTVSQTAWFEGQAVGREAHELWNQGFAFDYVSDSQLQEARVHDQEIVMPGAQYKVVVVPECHYMPLETLELLVGLMKSGATVVWDMDTLDQLQPAGLCGPEKTRRFESLVSQLMELRGRDSLSVMVKVGGGYMELGTRALGQGLWEAGVEPEEMAQKGLSFVRETTGQGWDYFIANRGKQDFQGLVKMGRPVTSAAVMDPMTGKMGKAKVEAGHGLWLELNAGESVLVRCYGSGKVTGPDWDYWETNGESVPVHGKWNLHFLVGGPELPEARELSDPVAWTNFKDPAYQAFGGTASYDVTFDAPDLAGKACYLDLGVVCQSARVVLNGQDLGTCVVPPYRVLVEHLKPSDNHLELEVTSVSANRVRDLDRRGVNWKYFKDINLVNEDYHPFDAANWPVAPCGLVGPVVLEPVHLRVNGYDPGI